MTEGNPDRRDEDAVSAATWAEFREAGLLWWVNQLLHTFGWAIVFELDDEQQVLRVYPARVTYRGFSAEAADRGYTRLTHHMVQEQARLLKDVEE